MSRRDEEYFYSNGNNQITPNRYDELNYKGKSYKKENSVYFRTLQGQDIVAKIVGFEPNQADRLINQEDVSLIAKPIYTEFLFRGLIGSFKWRYGENYLLSRTIKHLRN